MEQTPNVESPENREERLSSLRERLRARRHARTFEEIKRAHSERTGTNQLVEEPTDTGLWPTAGLNDTQVEMLTEVFNGRPTKR